MAKLTYEKAYAELQSILAEIQSDQTSLDDLSKKIKRAKSLVETCKTKLRETEAEIEEILN